MIRSIIPLLAVVCGLTIAGPDLRASGVLHHFTGITVDTNASVVLHLDGSVSNLFSLASTGEKPVPADVDIYVVDASADLKQWTRQAMLLRTNGDSTPLFWQDTNGAGEIVGFYRTPTNYFITPFRRPTGPYAVGKLTRLLTDPSRTNRYGIPTNSSFMSTFWYPVDPPGAGTLPAAYTDPAVARDTAYYNWFSWSTAWEPIITACVADSCTNLPVVSGTNRFPIIVHSPGLTCDRTANSELSAELASYGYFVAAVDHVDSHCTVYPDARGIRYAPPGTYSVDAALGQSRTNDMECLLNTLSQFDSADPILSGRLDLENIGAIGFSWGGGTAGEICRNDNRVNCVVLLDPAIFAQNGPNLVAGGLHKPFLTMNDTVAIHPSLLPTPSQLSDISSNLFYLATTNVTWLKVANASHTTFCDQGWTVDSGPGTRSAALAIDAAALWFFDTYLKGQTPSFPTNAEIIDVQQNDGAARRRAGLSVGLKKGKENIMRMKAILVSAVFLTLGYTTFAALHYVDPSSPNPTAPYTNWTTAAKVIQDAVDVAAAGDEVVVTNGTYATGGRVVYGTLTNRVAVTKPLFLHSVNGPNVTVIQGYQVPGVTNGDGAIRCVYLTNGASLSGFTLTKGATRRGAGDVLFEQSGGGVFCNWDNVLSNCVLTGNSATTIYYNQSGYNAGYGGGVFGGTLINCTLSGNSANQGGGAFGSTLNGCVLVGNSAESGGGASGCEFCGIVGTLNNCTISGNSANANGGGALDLTLINCTVSDNSAANGGGASDSQLRNCVVTGNSATTAGGGVRDSTLNNCAVSGNFAGGIGGGASGGTLNNCTLVGNSASQGGGAEGAWHISYDSGMIVWQNCSLNNCISFFNSSAQGANYGLHC